MRLLNPQGILLSLLLPFILFIYLRKERDIEYEIPSIKLWNEVLKEIEGIKVSRINNYFLLIIQLLIGVLITIALSQPQIIRGKNFEELTIFLDCSFSMKGKEGNQAYFEKAKEEVKDYINTLDDETNINLVLMKDKWEVLLAEGNKRTVLQSLKSIECSNESLNLDKFNDYFNRFKGERLVVTNKDLNLENKTIKVGENFDNLGILNAKYDYYNENLIIRIKNYSSKEKEGLISLVSENGEKDIKKINLLPKEEKDLIMEISKDVELVSIHIENEDMLIEDNTYFMPIGDKYKKDILLIGDNFFIEKALDSIPKIKYTKSNTLADEDKDYDLYIIAKDILIPEEIREKNIWYLVPESNLIEGKFQGTKEVFLEDGQLLQEEVLKEVYISDVNYLKDIKNFYPILKVENKPIMVYGLDESSKKAYSAIDMEKSNLGFTPYFPILVDELVDWFLDGEYYTEGKYINPPDSFIKGEIKINEENVNFLERKGIVSINKVLIVFAIIFLLVEWKVYSYANSK